MLADDKGKCLAMFELLASGASYTRNSNARIDSFPVCSPALFQYTVHHAWMLERICHPRFSKMVAGSSSRRKRNASLATFARRITRITTAFPLWIRGGRGGKGGVSVQGRRERKFALPRRNSKGEVCGISGF